MINAWKLHCSVSYRDGRKDNSRIDENKRKRKPKGQSGIQTITVHKTQDEYKKKNKSEAKQNT